MIVSYLPNGIKYWLAYPYIEQLIPIYLRKVRALSRIVGFVAYLSCLNYVFAFDNHNRLVSLYKMVENSRALLLTSIYILILLC